MRDEPDFGWGFLSLMCVTSAVTATVGAFFLDTFGAFIGGLCPLLMFRAVAYVVYLMTYLIGD